MLAQWACGGVLTEGFQLVSKYDAQRVILQVNAEFKLSQTAFLALNAKCVVNGVDRIGDHCAGRCCSDVLCVLSQFARVFKGFIQAGSLRPALFPTTISLGHFSWAFQSGGVW
jgi:hypothetical protein